MSREKRVYDSWAILLGISDWDKKMLEQGRSPFTGHGYMGVFFFTHNLADWHDGCRTALFRTRQQARNAIKATDLKRSWPRAKVERVTVTIEAVQ